MINGAIRFQLGTVTSPVCGWLTTEISRIQWYLLVRFSQDFEQDKLFQLFFLLLCSRISPCVSHSLGFILLLLFFVYMLIMWWFLIVIIFYNWVYWFQWPLGGGEVVLETLWFPCLVLIAAFTLSLLTLANCSHEGFCAVPDHVYTFQCTILFSSKITLSKKRLQGLQHMPGVGQALLVVILPLFPKQPVHVDGHIQKTQACLWLLASSINGIWKM